MAYPVPFLLVAVLNRMNGSPPGGIWWSYAFLGVPVLLLGLTLGQVCGSLLRNSYVAPVAAAALAFVLLATLGQRIHIVAMNGDAWLDVSVSAVVSRCVLGAGVVVLGWLPSALESVRTMWTPAGEATLVGAAALILLAGGGCAVVKTPEVQMARGPAAHPVCVGSRPRIYVWPDDAPYLREIERMQRGMAHLPKSFVVPDFYEPGLSRPIGAAELSTAGGRMWSAANAAAITIGLRTYPSTCVPDGAEAHRRFSEANFNIVGFLARSIHGPGEHGGESGGPPVDARELDAVIAAPLQRKIEWIHLQEKALHASPCNRG